MKKSSALHFVIAFAALAAAPALWAQTSSPKPLNFPSPKYPTELVDSGLNGEASVEILVRKDGSVAEPVLKSTDNPAFGVEAMAVVDQWKFQPGMKDGAPVEVRVVIPFQFKATFEQKVNAMAKRKVFLALPEPPMTGKEYGRLKVKGKARPVYPPALAKSGVKQDVKLKYVVTPDGTVVNPQFESEPNVQLIIPAIAAVSQMTYEPPVKKGKPVYVEASTTLHFEEPPPAPPGAKGKGKG